MWHPGNHLYTHFISTTGFSLYHTVENTYLPFPFPSLAFLPSTRPPVRLERLERCKLPQWVMKIEFSADQPSNMAPSEVRMIYRHSPQTNYRLWLSNESKGMRSLPSPANDAVVLPTTHKSHISTASYAIRATTKPPGLGRTPLYVHDYHYLNVKTP